LSENPDDPLSFWENPSLALPSAVDSLLFVSISFSRRRCPPAYPALFFLITSSFPLIFSFRRRADIPYFRQAERLPSHIFFFRSLVKFLPPVTESTADVFNDSVFKFSVFLLLRPL